MATDAQQSGPLPGNKFTQGRWAQIFGPNAGIVGDIDGSAFGITLPPSSDVAEIGSPTIESVCIVGGFPLIIPAGLSQSVTIPPSTNASVGRTDIIAARFDTATFNAAPGPLRLHRHGGTEGSTSLPGYDNAMPSPMSWPLWAVTRKQGQSLNQAVVRDLRMRSGWNYAIAPGGILPLNAPLGSRATRAGFTYRRDMDGSSVQWVLESEPPTIITNPLDATMAPGDGWARMASTRIERDGRWRIVTITVRRTGDPITSNDRGGLGDISIVQLHPTDRPIPGTPIPAYAQHTSNGSVQAGVHVSGQWIALNSLPPNTTISNPGVDNASLIISGVWKVA